MTVAASSAARALAGDIWIGNTAYAAGAATKAIAYSHQYGGRYIQTSLPSGFRSIVVGAWITFGPSASATSLYDYLIVHTSLGRYAAIQLRPEVGGYSLNVETDWNGSSQATTHSSNVTITPGATYWVSLRVDTRGSGSASMRVYDTAYTQVGSTVSTTMYPSDVLATLRVGNNEYGTETGSTSYFQNVMYAMLGQVVSDLGPRASTLPSIYVANVTAGTADSSASSIALSAMRTVSGRMLAVFVTSEGGSVSASGVSNTGGATWSTNAACKVTVSGVAVGEMWYGSGNTGQASDTITVTLSGSAPYRRAVAVEMVGASSWDRCAVGSVNSSSNPTTASFTPASAGASVLLGCSADNTASFLPLAGYFGVSPVGGNAGMLYKPDAGASAQTATAESSVSANKYCVAGVFK
jgi:hypothetical protein